MQHSAGIDAIYTPQEGTIPVFEKEYLRPEMQNTNALILVALDGERAAGYSYSLIIEPGNLALDTRRKYGFVHDLFIRGEYRRRGIGDKMYAENLKWFHSRDVDRVELHINTKNRAACSFWKKQGFGDFEHTWYRQL